MYIPGSYNSDKITTLGQKPKQTLKVNITKLFGTPHAKMFTNTPQTYHMYITDFNSPTNLKLNLQKTQKTNVLQLIVYNKDVNKSLQN